jgi:hypothetical protein
MAFSTTRSGILRVEGLKETRLMLDDVGARARRPETVLRSQGSRDELQAGEARRFNNPRGWRRNTDRWTTYKRRHGLDTRTARATGLLERALTVTEVGQAHGVTFRAYNGVLYWGIPGGRSDLYRAKAIARARGGRRGIKVVVIDKATKQRIVMRIQRYVAEGDL